MEAITTIATIPAIVAIVNLLKKFGIAGKASLAAAVVLGVAINLANYYLGDSGAYQTAVAGLILGLGAAGIWDVTSTSTLTLQNNNTFNAPEGMQFEEVADEGN